MRLWLLSDLHQEFPQFAWRPDHVPEHDVLVFAGDIDVTCEKAIAYARSITGKPVVMVAGNHEFYDQHWNEQIAASEVAASAAGNLFYLENRTAIIGDTRFIGATLWTDFNLFGEEKAWICEREAYSTVNDFRCIEIDPDEIDLATPRHIGDTRFRFSTRHAAKMHAASVAFIRDAMAKSFDDRTVVVTHHAPHPHSVPDRFKNDYVCASFVSDLDELIEDTQPDLWVHGHVHNSFAYEIGKTRIVCNPRGYGTENAAFDAGLVIEV